MTDRLLTDEEIERSFKMGLSGIWLRRMRLWRDGGVMDDRHICDRCGLPILSGQPDEDWLPLVYPVHVLRETCIRRLRDRVAELEATTEPPPPTPPR